MYSIQPGTDPKPPVDAELLEIMRGVYQRFTGYQLCEVVKVIRAEIDAEKEEAALDDEIAVLEEKVKRTRKKAAPADAESVK
jgi:hypothetical protein